MEYKIIMPNDHSFEAGKMNINLIRGKEENLQAELREKSIRERADQIMQDWFTNSPVCLATSSEVRKQGVVQEGFSPDNIRLIAMPDHMEGRVLEFYLKKVWGMNDTAHTRGMEEVAKAKDEFLPGQGIPADSFLFAFDTLPIYYSLREERDLPLRRWRGKTEKKPNNLEQRKRIITDTFLNIIKNYLEYKSFLQKSGGKKSENDKMYQKMDFATGIHVKTAFAVRFPHENDIFVDSDRIIVKPHRLYELADQIDVGTEDISNISLETMGHKTLPSGKLLLEEVNMLIDDITIAMQQDGVSPFQISGGIAYHLERVKDILKVEERPNVIDSEKLDTSIYTGFPKNLFQRVLHDKAYALARAEFEIK